MQQARVVASRQWAPLQGPTMQWRRDTQVQVAVHTQVDLTPLLYGSSCSVHIILRVSCHYISAPPRVTTSSVIPFVDVADLPYSSYAGDDGRLLPAHTFHSSIFSCQLLTHNTPSKQHAALCSQGSITSRPPERFNLACHKILCIVWFRE